MKTKRFFVNILKFFGICLAMIFSFIIASGIANPGATTQSASQTPEETAQAGMALIIVSVVNALLLAYPIIRSRWHGWKLIGTMTLFFFGTQTFMSQIETLFFGSAFDISADTMKNIILSGFLTALFFIPLAALILGKIRKPATEGNPTESISLPWQVWAKRLAILPLAYIALYFIFGYFIAWQSSDVRWLYSGSTEILPFFEHMSITLQASPEIIPFQFLRGLIWIGLAFPLLNLMKGGTFEKSITLGLLFGLLLTTQLLFPNPYMPAPVRLAHFIETSTSTFIYGWLIGQIFTSPKE